MTTCDKCKRPHRMLSKRNREGGWDEVPSEFCQPEKVGCEGTEWIEKWKINGQRAFFRCPGCPDCEKPRECARKKPTGGNATCDICHDLILLDGSIIPGRQGPTLQPILHRGCLPCPDCSKAKVSITESAYEDVIVAPGNSTGIERFGVRKAKEDVCGVCGLDKATEDGVYGVGASAILGICLGHDSPAAKPEPEKKCKDCYEGKHYTKHPCPCPIPEAEERCDCVRELAGDCYSFFNRDTNGLCACSCHPASPVPAPSWQEVFNEKFEDVYCVDCLKGSWKREHIKSFITDLVAKERAVAFEDGYTNHESSNEAYERGREEERAASLAMLRRVRAAMVKAYEAGEMGTGLFEAFDLTEVGKDEKI